MPEMSQNTIALVLDESAHELNQLCSWFGELGYKAVGFRRAIEAAEWLRTCEALFVVCDIELPGTQGPWLLSELRSSGNPVPFYLMAEPDERSSEHLYKEGVDGHLPKSLVYSRIFDRLSQMKLAPTAEADWIKYG